MAVKKKEKEEGLLSFEDGSSYPYEIIKSDRRTMALQVKKSGEVVVRIPRGLSFHSGHELAEKNKSWVYSHMKGIEASLKKKEGFHWEEGARLLFFGRGHILRVVPDFGRKSFRVLAGSGELILRGPVEKKAGAERETVIKEVMKLFYRQEARKYLEKKTAGWAADMKISYGRIAVRDQATRWGSCSIKGNLNFNWRLVLLPEELADYVVVHELAHRIHMNHSREFWGVVEGKLPDYRLRRKLLKSYEEEIYGNY
ncbi:MAG: SprT family zinc-dependent metalloprotease [Lacrimispora sp.]|uniref:M48 family metallopeptidase n=1 Tax=Lacrimispora sp. TaxID=2719234 RepID=UPI0039E6C94B